mmetsp:Transcript_27395/g.109727  ORF Transcript_27395/g.109727 Transcript_27395/m.109727 type:complete len:206 (-) Transcript_27395:9-626(-)
MSRVDRLAPRSVHLRASNRASTSALTAWACAVDSARGSSKTPCPCATLRPSRLRNPLRLPLGLGGGVSIAAGAVVIIDRGVVPVFSGDDDDASAAGADLACALVSRNCDLNMPITDSAMGVVVRCFGRDHCSSSSFVPWLMLRSRRGLAHCARGEVTSSARLAAPRSTPGPPLARGGARKNTHAPRPSQGTNSSLSRSVKAPSCV